MFSKAFSKFPSDLNNIIKDPIGIIKGGPKGSFGTVVDKLYGGTLKDIVEGAQGKTDDPILDPVAPPLLASGEVDANANLQAYQQNRKNKFGRMESNLSQGTGSSILTS
tara:strand:+ start:186 stop:512 length:327 start_codon:yes stop_codon:yes gene_type:complete